MKLSVIIPSYRGKGSPNGPVKGPLGISALICTADRGDSLIPTVKSILRPDSILTELVIVDQSRDDRTEEALRPFLSDPRLRYLRLSSRGKGRALNFGLQQCVTDIVAITDDDCEVAPGWPNYHLQIMNEHPQVAVSYGNVYPVEYDRKAGFIPDYFITKDLMCRNIWHKLHARGIGANMAVRRHIISDIGGFDPSLGPGGQFFACVDGDITVRALLAGYHVYECAQSKVLHYGFRSWEQGRAATRNAWIGIGAAYAKPLKCGRWDALPLPVYEFVWHALLPFLWSCITLRPKGWLRVTSFLKGFSQGCRTPVDRIHILYRLDERAPS